MFLAASLEVVAREQRRAAALADVEDLARLVALVAARAVEVGEGHEAIICGRADRAPRVVRRGCAAAPRGDQE